MRSSVQALGLALVICLSGCTRYVYTSTADGTLRRLPADEDIVVRNQDAARILALGMRRPLPCDEPILVASFVHIDDLTKSSTFGRLIADQLAAGLVKQGYNVVEMKLRQEGVFIEEGAGEFLLSRELKAISAQHEATAVLVGTYAVGRDVVYVNARLVAVEDNSILSAHGYALPIGLNLGSLLIESTFIDEAEIRGGSSKLDNRFKGKSRINWDTRHPCGADDCRH